MIKKNNFLIYVKLFKFKLFFNNLKILINQKLILNFINIFKILLNFKHFGVFIPDSFDFKNNWIFSFWKKGFISNFVNLKWFFIKFIYLKKLPLILINLTSNKYISLESFNKKIPLINLFQINKLSKKKNLGDYFLHDFGNIINLDVTFFYLKIFSYLKKYKNV